MVSVNSLEPRIFDIYIEKGPMNRLSLYFKNKAKVDS